MTEQVKMTHSQRRCGRTEIPSRVDFPVGFTELKANHGEVSD
jgi:hypothetical protein